MLFKDISIGHDYIFLAETIQAHFRQIRILLFFSVATFLHMSQLGVPVPELGSRISKLYRIFK